MARKLRIEYAGAKYHVINRGNYREHLFAEEKTKQAFLHCLGEAAQKAGWIVHAYVIMSNHYHLAVETPAGNLVEGMRWLQSTFANRFNRLRGERGHVFQGRYQALLIEPDGLGAVAHYIHLNPVRAGLVRVDNLSDYAASSFPALYKPSSRPTWLSLQACLHAAGELTDTPAGRKKYAEYLAWLAENEPAQKQLKFDTMSRGWAVGGETFKNLIAREHQGRLGKAGASEAATREARELAGAAAIQALLKGLGKTEAELATSRKSAPWKIAIAAHLKRSTTLSNPWLAQRLHMGAAAGVSRYVQEQRAGQRADADKFLKQIAKVMV